MLSLIIDKERDRMNKKNKPSNKNLYWRMDWLFDCLFYFAEFQ